MTTVLRRTVGFYSAGTQVTVDSRANDLVTVRPWCSPNVSLELSPSDLVERRPQDGLTRRQRAKLQPEPAGDVDGP